MNEAKRYRVFTLTMSDTREAENDESGRLLGELLRAAGFEVASHAILREEPDALREAIWGLFGAGADAVVVTGGTGIAPRDRTLEVIEPMFEKELPGFGEAFRRLGFDRIGSRALLSRAAMGVVRRRVVVALPGSPGAVRLAVEELLAPMLKHAIELASGASSTHEPGHGKDAGASGPARGGEGA